MCKNIKQNTTDLRGKIGELIDAIDGNIVAFEKRVVNGGSYYASRNGKTISQTIISFDITTTTGTYYLGVQWETANNFAKEEVGIRNIGISQLTPQYQVLVIIEATNGVGNWHD